MPLLKVPVEVVEVGAELVALAVPEQARRDRLADRAPPAVAVQAWVPGAPEAQGQ
jgi:hypothetical protein